jgi:hypothetical protein
MAATVNTLVVETVWKWRAGHAAPKARLSHHLMAVVQFLVACSVATFFLLAKKRVVLGSVLYTIGALLLLSNFFVPSIYDAFSRLSKWFGRVIGVGTTWLLLVPFYYLFFATAHACLVLQGKDPLTRRLDRNAATYWTDRPPVTDAAHFTRQS